MRLPLLTNFGNVFWRGFVMNSYKYVLQKNIKIAILLPDDCIKERFYIDVPAT